MSDSATTLPVVTAPRSVNHADWTLFGSTTGWLDEGTPGLDLRTGRPVLPDDHDEPYWREHGYGGTGQIVCLDCFAGLVSDVEAETRVPLIYRGPTDRRAHFAHPKGHAHESVGGPGESVWHLRAKRLLRDWAAAQESVVDAVLEWRTVDGDRRADVFVTTARNGGMALEAQQRTLPPLQWRARRGDYARQHVRDFWFWPTTVRRPDTTDDGRTCFAIDPDGARLGLIVNARRSAASGDRLEFRWPADRWLPMVALWAPASEWSIDSDGAVRPPEHLEARTHAAAPLQLLGRPAHADRGTTRRTPPAATNRATTSHYGYARATEPRRTQAGVLSCDGCGERLDPLWHRMGRHPDCKRPSKAGARTRSQPGIAGRGSPSRHFHASPASSRQLTAPRGPLCCVGLPVGRWGGLSRGCQRLQPRLRDLALPRHQSAREAGSGQTEPGTRSC